MAFTAADVKNLREKTGVGMMDCKRALDEADGDFERALENLRERGMAAASKKAARVTSEGVVGAYRDGDTFVLAEVNSETDFVGKNPEFRAFVQDIAKTVADGNPADLEALAALPLAGAGRTVEESRQDRILSMGENLSIRRFARVAGNPAVASYVHGGGAIGVLAIFNADEAVARGEAFQAMAKDVAMQIAAMSPLFLSAAAVPAEFIEEKKAAMAAELAEDPKMAGKPEKMLEGIIKGKLAKFLKESCLLDQVFIKDDEITVGKYIANAAAELGVAIEATDFVRFIKGENLQKREDDFAAEVAKAAGQA